VQSKSAGDGKLKESRRSSKQKYDINHVVRSRRFNDANSRCAEELSRARTRLIFHHRYR